MCGRFYFFISPLFKAQNLAVTVLSDSCHYQALAEMAVSESDAASKAQGLYETFQQGNVVLGLVCALEITGELEVLNITMTQTRLNSVAVCHVHKDKLDRVNRKKIAEQFVSCKEGRKSTFGSFKGEVVGHMFIGQLLVVVGCIYICILGMFILTVNRPIRSLTD